MRTYIAIDLKSFYASVECIERDLDPLNTHLVVADNSRTDKTICLAVSPSLKALGISGRPRLFEVIQRVKEINKERRYKLGYDFISESFYDTELKRNPELKVSYITAPPRMAYYIEYSTRIYNVYLKYIAPEDIHVYSIDEVFMDVTDYLNTYQKTAEELAMTIILDVLKTTGITATAGIGSNMYLAKVAMDIVAKHKEADENGVRIASLDEISYREQLWNHRPLTDFWRIGAGTARKLEKHGMYTLGDIARCSIGKDHEYYNEELLYKLFGINAELLIDHAWGYEPCTIKDVKSYKPKASSLGTGQVLHKPYSHEKAKLIVKEMAELLSLDLVRKKLVTNQLVLTVGYDIGNVENGKYQGEVKIDHYGRKIPKHAHGTINLKKHTASTKIIMQAIEKLYLHITDSSLQIRRINISANNIIDERENIKIYDQLSLFEDIDEIKKREELEEKEEEKEKNLQKALLEIKNKFGKNAVLKGMNLEEDATTKDRNAQIGGHKA